MMQIITKHFTEFGLRVAESKTVTMTWRTTPDIQEATTLISLHGKDLENVRSLCYLRHWLTDDPKHPKHLNQKVGAAQGAWSEDRRFYTDKDINLHTRVKVAEARVRSRLTYALQSDRLTGRQCRTVDSVWMRILRSMVRGGFARNGPDSTRFTLSNASILSACNTRLASSFCQQQHLRYLAHVCRMENDVLQKQLLFAPPRKKEVSHWKRLANDYKIDKSQLRRTTKRR